MKPNRSPFSIIVLFFVIAFVATACVPRSAPVYKGGLAQEPAKMTPYVDEKNGITMALPPGWKSVPLWALSQNGCFWLLPHTHHQYLRPGMTSTAIGSFWAITGSVIISLRDCSLCSARLSLRRAAALRYYVHAAHNRWKTLRERQAENKAGCNFRPVCGPSTS